MSTRLRSGKLLTPILTAAGALAFVLIGASPAAAHNVHEEAFTAPRDSVRITGDDVDNREFSVRITDNREFSVRITKFPRPDNREFSIAPVTGKVTPDNREW
jgi:hypothetical protein